MTRAASRWSATTCRRPPRRRSTTQAGIGPEDVDVIELHDCFSCNELITYEALGLCEEGHAGELVDAEATTYGGKWVVNPSGGLISKGHPLGATGLAQCAELNWQLRGMSEKRQVEGARIGLQHNIGLGGAAVVTMYGKKYAGRGWASARASAPCVVRESRGVGASRWLRPGEESPGRFL